MRRPTRAGTGRLVAILGAFSFFLSAVEYTFPKPLPFVRLGIANLPLLVGIDLLPLPSLLLLALVKFLGMSLVSGTLFSYVALFSAAGSLSAALAMWLARKAGGRVIGPVGVSIAGAMASSAAQLLLARIFIFGPAAWFVAPLLLSTSLATGLLLGLFASSFTGSSVWFGRQVTVGAPGPVPVPGEGPPTVADPGPVAVPPPSPVTVPRPASEGRRARAEAWDARFSPLPLALAGVAASFLLLFIPSLGARLVLAPLFAALAWLSGRKIALGPALLMTAGIVLAGLVVPVGRVLFTLGPLLVTETALVEGLSRALAFQGLLYASRAAIRPGLRFPGRLGELVSLSFLGYQRILDSGIKPRPSTFVADADRLLLDLEEALPRRG